MKNFQIFIIAIIVITIVQALAGCSPNSNVDKLSNPSADSVSFAVYRATPLVIDTNNKVYTGAIVEPVYICLDDFGVYRTGDTIEVNKNHVIPGIIIKDSDGLPQTSTHWVILRERLNHNRTVSRDQAEEEQ